MFLDDAKASNCQKNNGFSDLGDYAEWPKVAGAVIQARQFAEMSHVEAEQNSVMIGSNFGSALILAQPIALAGHVVFHALAGAQAPYVRTSGRVTGPLHPYYPKAIN